MVDLVPMTGEGWQAYYEQAVVDYAQDHVDEGDWDAEGALERSRQEFERLLPEGTASPGQHIYSIRDTESGQEVGMIWFAVEVRGKHPVAFIYDFVIREENRRKGYGTQALAAVEAKVKELGLDTISLHVFGHNLAARELYNKAGFQVSHVMMSKKVN